MIHASNPPTVADRATFQAELESAADSGEGAHPGG